jgi:hypothetical protein
MRLTQCRGSIRVLWYGIRWRSLRRLVRRRRLLGLYPEADNHRIGEISLMKDLTHTMDIYGKEAEEQEAAAAATAADIDPTSGAKPVFATTETDASPARDTTAAGSTADADAPPPYDFTSTLPTHEKKARASSIDPTSTFKPSSSHSGTTAASSNPYSQDRPKGVSTRLALTSAEEASRETAAGMTPEEQRLREKEKKKGLSKEQREELRAYELERQRIRDERVRSLASRLVDRISVWTETDKGADVTKAFKEKTRLEIENLKMESFGLEILHAIGMIYLFKATSLLKSTKMFGMGSFWSRLKDKGQMAKDTWGTISTAIDAQMSMEEMAKAEEAGGDAWTDERRAELEKRVTGKILAAAWKGSKFEIQSVLREVCDVVLEDTKVSKQKRMERAQAMVVIGEMCRDARRTEDEEGDYLVFEQLMADAQVKRDKKEEKKKSKEEKKTPAKPAGEKAAV